jgi:hypothetical protein
MLAKGLLDFEGVIPVFRQHGMKRCVGGQKTPWIPNLGTMWSE